MIGKEIHDNASAKLAGLVYLDVLKTEKEWRNEVFFRKNVKNKASKKHKMIDI
jgi:hypothetical protein